MPIKVVLQDQLPIVHVVFRLNAKDTAFVYERMHQAIEMGKGMDFTIQKSKGSITLVETKENGFELRIGAYEDGWSYMITCPMEGYAGKWDQVEVYFNAKAGRKAIEDFFSKVKQLKPNPSGVTYHDYYSKE